MANSHAAYKGLAANMNDDVNSAIDATSYLMAAAAKISAQGPEDLGADAEKVHKYAKDAQLAMKAAGMALDRIQRAIRQNTGR